jgi:hypothetical protein
LRKDRKLGKHGGVAVYVKSTLSTNMCCDLDGHESHESHEIHDGHEILWIRVSLANRVLYVACVYRPPISDDSVFENLSKALEFFSLVEEILYHNCWGLKLS